MSLNLSTQYLGLKLRHPLIVGASPLVDNLPTVRKLEDCGASAIVMHSLFEEQIAREESASAHHVAAHSESFAEALSFFPAANEYHLGPQAYLEHIRKMKLAVHIPIIASLNGATGQGWVRYAKLMEEAGADALELNMYMLATDVEETSASIEDRIVQITRDVIGAIKIPVAVKLSPFFSSLPNLARRLDDVHVAGLVLFNRFYQPDIDIEALDVAPRLVLSDSSELLLRLRWLAVLSGQVKASLAATGGVHTGSDAIKALMAGASAIQVVSAVLKHGPERLTSLLAEVQKWMESHEYESVTQMRGSMNLSRCPNPAAFERANYTRVLMTWRP